MHVSGTCVRFSNTSSCVQGRNPMISSDSLARALTFQQPGEVSGRVKNSDYVPWSKQGPALEYPLIADPVEGNRQLDLAAAVARVGDPVTDRYVIRAVLEHA